MIGYSRAFNELYGPKPIEGKSKMNERIRELWEQAAKTTQGDSWEEQTKFMEKFAELILFECVKIAVFKGDAATGRAIKQHFGVE